MRKFYATIFFALMTLTASAQSADAVYVRVDFNLNPWNLPVSIPNRDTAPNNGWGVSWSLVEDVTGCFTDTHVFDWDVNGEKILLTLTPANYKLTDYDNALVKTHNLDITEEPIETMLWMRRGSTLSFKAPESMWFEKIAFNKYRNWANGSLYSSELTNYETIWGKDSVKVRETVSGGQTYRLDCWSGDSVEWSLPECTGNTFLRYIDIWLLPRKTTGINELKANSRSVSVSTLDGVLLRRERNHENAFEGLRKGIYIVNGKKYVVK